MYENKFPNKVGKMIAVDAGQNIDLTWRLVLYQSLLAFVYLISQLFGDIFATALMSVLHGIIKCFPFLGVLKANADIRYYFERCNPRVNMAYPYYYVYHNILTGNMKKMLSKFPSCPFLFMVTNASLFL